MKKLLLRSAPEQVADHLMDEISRGGFRQGMPGYRALAELLGVNHKTVNAALKLLVARGLVAERGSGRRASVIPSKSPGRVGLKVRIMIFSSGDRTNRNMLELMYHLNSTGHSVDFASRSLWDLKMDTRRLARFVENNPADAWIVVGGSREILAWFADQEYPSFAVFGRMRSARIAGVKPDKIPALRQAVRRLTDLGHRRVVMLSLEERVFPRPGLPERSFLEALESAGIQTGSYNLCAWNGNPAELYVRLDSLFRHSPPTALICDVVSVFNAARDHLARRGILSPDHVSMLCMDPDPPFLWVRPSVAHIHWSFQPIARRVVKWLENVAGGKEDRAQTFTKASFVDGGTIGAVPGGKTPR